MAYIDTGLASNETVIFLHGNPTSSYLQRNVIPKISSKASCVAPDLIRMGRSGKPSIQYRFSDHAQNLDAFPKAIVPGAMSCWSSTTGAQLLLSTGHDDTRIVFQGSL
jgi:haloalkane dehalogenase